MILQAFIFMTGIKVEPVTLISMILAAMIGSLFGAEIVSKLDEKKSAILHGGISSNCSFNNFSRTIKFNASRW